MSLTLPYPTDPSLPSNPAPVFSDLTAARGDHLRANNAEIWANLVAIATMINSGSIIYNYIVDSQTKFNTLVASETWLGAKNVLFTIDVTRSSQTIIPATVEKIHAINGATLTATGLTNGQNGIGYATRPTDLKYEIVGLSVTASGTGRVSAFYQCTNLRDCTGTSVTTTGGDALAFYLCAQINNCSGSATGFTTDAVAFYQCYDINGCSGLGQSSSGGAASAYGFHTCGNIIGSTGTGIGTVLGAGFFGSYRLVSCVGTGTSLAVGYGFNTCNQMSLCDHGACTTANYSSCTIIRGCTSISDDS